MDGAATYGRYETTRYIPDGRRKGAWSVICGYVQRFIPRDGAVLDIGAGYCDFINQIAARRRVALDVRPEYRAHAHPVVEARVGSCHSLEWAEDGSFDAVWASNVMEHLSRSCLEMAIREIRRVLKPGGVLLIMQPNYRLAYREYFDDFTHRSDAIFSDRSMADFLANGGFEIVRCEPRFLPFSFRSALPAHPLIVRFYLMSPIRPLARQMLVEARKSNS